MAETYTPKNLFAGDVMPFVTDSVVIAAGQTLQAGAVLGMVSDTGKYVLMDSTATDGSQNPVAILAQDVDASAGDTIATVYLTGEFNSDALVFGGTDTVDTPLWVGTIKDALRMVGIFCKRIV